MDGADENLIRKLECLTPRQRARAREYLASLKGKVIATRSDAAPVARRGGDSYVPSFAQERMWVLSQLIAAPEAYNISVALEVEGRLDLSRLRMALQTLVDRHDCLRTTLMETPDGLRCVIHDSNRVHIEHIHAPRGIARGTEWMSSLASQLARIPFLLDKLPLIRITAVEVSDQHWLLVLVMHHVIADAWSASLMAHELTSAYANPESLPHAAGHGCADYAVWQKQRFASGELEEGLGWWRAHLQGCPETLDLPFDRPRPRRMSYRGRQVEVTADNIFRERLLRLAQAADCSLGTVLLGILQVFLARYSSQNDFAIGIPMANREPVWTRGIWGCLINTVALRQEVELTRSFMEHLQEARRGFIEAVKRQETPFEKLVEQLHPQRSMALTPLFEVLFNYLEEPPLQFQLPQLRLRAIPFDPEVARVSLALEARNCDQGLTLRFQFSTDLFDRITIECMAENFLFFAGEICDAPERPLFRHGLVSPSQFAALTAPELRA